MATISYSNMVFFLGWPIRTAKTRNGRRPLQYFAAEEEEKGKEDSNAKETARAWYPGEELIP